MRNTSGISSGQFASEGYLIWQRFGRPQTLLASVLMAIDDSDRQFDLTLKK